MKQPNICTSTSQWCDECTEYFSKSKPGIVFKVRSETMRLCLDCLKYCARVCEQAVEPEMPEGTRK